MTDTTGPNYDYLSDPILGGVIAYYLAARGTKMMPCRADLRPKDLQPMLPHIQLVDVEDNGARFRYRLIGTKVTSMMGRDTTGQYFDEVMDGERLERALHIAHSVVNGKQSVFVHARYVTERGNELVTNRIYLPMSEDGNTVSMILSAVTFESPASVVISGTWMGGTIDKDVLWETLIALPKPGEDLPPVLKKEPPTRLDASDYSPTLVPKQPLAVGARKHPVILQEASPPTSLWGRILGG